MENTIKIRSVMIIPNVTKPETLEYTDKLIDFFEKKEIKTYVVKDVSAKEDIPLDIDMAVVLGGDGSVLVGASYLDGMDVPIIGINFGHFGYLTECEPRDGFEAIEQVLRGNYIIEERMMLSCKLFGESNEDYTEYSALNEAVIYRGSLMHILDIPLCINNKPITNLLCDGIIICTPTGSTAYNLSAGGPVLVPTSENIAITPICQRNPSCSSIVTSGSDTVGASVDKTAFLCIDGQKQIRIEKGARLIFTKSDRKTKIIKISDGSFYTALQKKLSKEME
ncbi:MAG: NAD(+)/NADH kinase [Ruminococcaceae bacterium]|nr:NAD(+)/NADH kinase [Oscillospiraceae bacterium]